MDAVVAVTLTSQDFAAGTVAGGTHASLLDASGNVIAQQSAATGGADTSDSVTFPSVPDGTYTVSVVRQDSNGNVLGLPVTSAAFTVQGAGGGPTTVAITVPTAVNVTVQ